MQIDNAITLYHIITAFVQAESHNPTFGELHLLSGYKANSLWIDLITLESWGWIKPNWMGGRIIPNLPTENIILRPRPVQEVQS